MNNNNNNNNNNDNNNNDNNNNNNIIHRANLRVFEIIQENICHGDQLTTLHSVADVFLKIFERFA